MNGFTEERILIEALRQGKEEAYVFLFDCWYDALANYAFRLFKDMEAASDIVQSLFCKMYENRSSLSISSSLRAYLYTSIYHLCLNELQHQKVVASYGDDVRNFFSTEVLQTPEAELNLIDQDLEARLHRAISLLPEKCREVFLCSREDGLSYKEIAEKLDISVKTVEVHISRALSLLRAELGNLL